MPFFFFKKTLQFLSTETGTYDWEEPGIGRNLIYMVTTGIGFFVILLVIEYRVFAGLVYFILSFFERKLPPMSQNGQIDDDVNAEKRRVNGMTLSDLDTNNLVLQSLSKFYGKFLAVNQISIGINRLVKKYVRVQAEQSNIQSKFVFHVFTEPNALDFSVLMVLEKHPHSKC